MTKLPQHVAITLDGNRRYAKKHGLKPWRGHESGAKKVEQLLEWCSEVGIKQLTLWILSTENLHRNQKEVSVLMELFDTELRKWLDSEELQKKQIQIRFIGRLHMLPKEIQSSIQQLEHKTKNNSKFLLTFAAAYGGRAEIVDATKKIAQKVLKKDIQPADINEQLFADHLYMKDEPDLIIRTSEHRLSGFLPFQSHYAEILFLPDILWPEFTKKDFLSCIETYSTIQRRFGK